MRTAITEFCAKIGRDPLLVQGAGGNVSWKDGDTLWIKASGMWLVDATSRDIFVPVLLSNLDGAISVDNWNAQPQLSAPSNLRPSIETMLHAVMPHKVVAHLHPVDVLTWVVRKGFANDIQARLADVLSWTSIDYFKPGPELAKAVHSALAVKPDCNVVLLANHGIIAGADSVDELADLLRKVLAALHCPEIRRPQANKSSAIPAWLRAEAYKVEFDLDIAALALNEELLNRARVDWALYPDHVVFLGEQPIIHDAVHDDNAVPNLSEHFGYAIVPNVGVFTAPNFNNNQRAMLKCYGQLLKRLPSDLQLRTLSRQEIGDLLNWDAELYRKSIAR